MSFGLRRPVALAIVPIGSLCILTLRYGRHPSVVHAQAAGPGQIAVFSPQSSYGLTPVEIGGQPYVGLIELLEPLGSVEAKINGKKLKLQL